MASEPDGRRLDHFHRHPGHRAVVAPFDAELERPRDVLPPGDHRSPSSCIRSTSAPPCRSAPGSGNGCGLRRGSRGPGRRSPRPRTAGRGPRGADLPQGEMRGLRPGQVAQGIDEPGQRDPRSRRVQGHDDGRHERHGQRPPPRPAAAGGHRGRGQSSRSVSAVAWAITARRSAGRAGRRIVLRLPQELDRADQPVVQRGKRAWSRKAKSTSPSRAQRAEQAAVGCSSPARPAAGASRSPASRGPGSGSSSRPAQDDQRAAPRPQRPC